MAAAELVGDGELELPVDAAADDEVEVEVEVEEAELEHALAPTAKANATLEPATTVPIRRTCLTCLTVLIIESLSCGGVSVI